MSRTENEGRTAQAAAQSSRGEAPASVPSSSPADPTPHKLGYRWPAEWEPHTAVWLAWPHDPVSFPYLEQAESSFAEFVHAVHQTEGVELLVLDEQMRLRADRLLAERGTAASQIRFHTAGYTDIWFRDYGPIFLTHAGEKRLAMAKWVFNAWGGKYEPLRNDNDVPYFMNRGIGLPLFEAGMVLEGGSIDGNGRGALLTTEQCLLNPNRNPGLSRRQIEQKLGDYLGAQKIIWLKRGIEGDDTDGHVDDIARFAGPDTVLCVLADDPSDPDYQPLRENYEILREAEDQDGRLLKVITLPSPGRIGDQQGRLPASYANFYIANGKVLVPLFGSPADARALDAIQSAFPDRLVVGINALYLLYGLGTFHCMTQQQPAV